MFRYLAKKRKELLPAAAAIGLATAASSSEFNTSAGISDIAVPQDLNGDGFLDIVIIHTDQSATIHWGATNYQTTTSVSGQELYSLISDKNQGLLIGQPTEVGSFKGQVAHIPGPVGPSNSSIPLPAADSAPGLSNNDYFGSALTIEVLDNGKVWGFIGASGYNSAEGLIYEFIIDDISQLSSLNFANPSADSRIRTITPQVGINNSFFGTRTDIRRRVDSAPAKYDVIVSSFGSVTSYNQIDPTVAGYLTADKNTADAAIVTSTFNSFGRHVAPMNNGTYAVASHQENKVHLLDLDGLAPGNYALSSLAADKKLEFVGQSGDNLGKYGVWPQADLHYNGQPSIAFSANGKGSGYLCGIPDITTENTVSLEGVSNVPSLVAQKVHAVNATISSHGFFPGYNATHYIAASSGTPVTGLPVVSFEQTPSVFVTVPSTAVVHNEDTPAPFNIRVIDGSKVTLRPNIIAGQSVSVTPGAGYSIQDLGNGVIEVTIIGSDVTIPCLAQNGLHSNGNFAVDFEVMDSLGEQYAGAVQISTAAVPTEPEIAITNQDLSSCEKGQTCIYNLDVVITGHDGETVSLQKGIQSSEFCSVLINKATITTSEFGSTLTDAATFTCAPPSDSAASNITMTLTGTNDGNGASTSTTASVPLLTPSATPAGSSGAPSPGGFKGFAGSTAGKITFAVIGVATLVGSAALAIWRIRKLRAINKDTEANTKNLLLAENQRIIAKITKSDSHFIDVESRAQAIEHMLDPIERGNITPAGLEELLKSFGHTRNETLSHEASRIGVEKFYNKLFSIYSDILKKDVKGKLTAAELMEWAGLAGQRLAQWAKKQPNAAAAISTSMAAATLALSSDGSSEGIPLNDLDVSFQADIGAGAADHDRAQGSSHTGSLSASSPGRSGSSFLATSSADGGLLTTSPPRPEASTATLTTP